MQQSPSVDRLIRFLADRRPRHNPFSFILSQPFGVCWEIGNEEEGGKANGDGRNAFEDKDPPPATQSAYSIHVGDGAGKKATKHAGGQDGAPVDGEALLGFFALVPEANKIKTWRRSMLPLPTVLLDHPLPGNMPASAKPRKNLVAMRPE